MSSARGASRFDRRRRGLVAGLEGSWLAGKGLTDGGAEGRGGGKRRLEEDEKEEEEGEGKEKPTEGSAAWTWQKGGVKALRVSAGVELLIQAGRHLMAAAWMDCRHLLHRSGGSETAIANIRWQQRQRYIRQRGGSQFRRDAGVLQPLPTSLAATLGVGMADLGMGYADVRRQEEEEEEEEERRREGEEEEEEEEEHLHQRRG